MNWTKGPCCVTDDQDQMDISMIHGFLATSYWAGGIDRATVERSIVNSLSMGLFRDQNQIGFGRAVTDRSTFAYLADVFVIPEHRGHGLGTWLVDCFMEHPKLQGLRRWLLATADAHGMYSKVGFAPLKVPDKWMEKLTSTRTA